jgi:SAM-dependent methyltransferase
MMDDRDYSDIIEYEKHAAPEHSHRGKTTESFLDMNAVLAALGIKSGQTVLDAGCGGGYMSRVFAGLVGSGGRVYALDRDDAGIAALKAESAGTVITALVGDITVNTGLPSSSFDLIYLSNVVHGFNPGQFPGFREEVGRLLAPGGRLAIVEIVKRATPFGPPMERRVSPEDLQRLLGLVPLSTCYAGEYFYVQLFGKPEGNPHDTACSR